MKQLLQRRAWLGVEYHANTHSTTGRAPGLYFESELAYVRPVPEDISLRDVLLYEVPGDLFGERVELRYDPRRKGDLPLVFHRGAYRDGCSAPPAPVRVRPVEGVRPNPQDRRLGGGRLVATKRNTPKLTETDRNSLLPSLPPRNRGISGVSGSARW